MYMTSQAPFQPSEYNQKVLRWEKSKEEGNRERRGAKHGGLTSVMLTLRGLKHEGCQEFKAIQSYIDFQREG